MGLKVEGDVKNNIEAKARVLSDILAAKENSSLPVSSVVEVDPEGKAVVLYTVGNQSRLRSGDAFEAMNRTGIKIKTS